MSNNSRGQHARRSGGKKRCPARPGSKKGVLTAFFIVAALLFVTFAVVQDSNENYSAGATIGLSTTDLHNELVLFTVDGNGVNEVTDTFDLLPGKIYKFELLGGGHNGLNAKGGISIGWYDATHNASIVTAYYHVGGMGGGSGQGGANGGGSGGPLSSASELGGCGASDIRIGGDTLADRVIIAGGGGGGSSSTTAGGAGGGANGGSGYFISTRHPGGGGTQTGGGNGGGGSVPGSIGSWGIGGAGGGKGGGGGGGYYGGGGGGGDGGGAGGGGGSGYIGGVDGLLDSPATTTSNYNFGEGQVKVTEYETYGVIGKVTDVYGNPLNGVTISYTVKGVPGTTATGTNGIYAILLSRSVLPADIDIKGVTLTNYFLDTAATPLPSSPFDINGTTPFHSGADFQMLQRYAIYDDVAGILIGSEYWLRDAVALCSVSGNPYTIIAAEDDTDMTNSVSAAIAIPASIEITLVSDSSGPHTITMQGYARHFIINGGDLKLDNMILRGMGDTGGSTRGGVSVYNAAGCLTLDNAAIQNCYCAGDGGAVDLAGNAKLVINSGAISDSRAGGSGSCVFSDNGMITMYGGSVSSTAGGSTIWNNSAGEIEISGGTVQGTAGGIAVTNNDGAGKVAVSGAATVTSDGSTTINNNGLLDISGGTVSNTDAAAGGRLIGNDGTVNITGGTLTSGNKIYSIENSTAGVAEIGGDPVIAGTILTAPGNLSVSAFVPSAGKVYTVALTAYNDGYVVVTDGDPYEDNFALPVAVTDFVIITNGTDLILKALSKVTVTIVGSGSVDVTFRDQHGNSVTFLNVTGSVYVFPGDVTFTPNNGTGMFSHWFDGTSTSDDNPFYVSIAADYAITAYFYDGSGSTGDGSYIITVNINGGGSVDVKFTDQGTNPVTVTMTASGTVAVYGTNVGFEAAAGSGSIFSHWLDAGVSTANPYDVIGFSDPYAITVYFDLLYSPPASYYITAASDARTSISPEGRITVPGGTDKTFTFSADEGYHIRAVVVDGTDLSWEEIERGYYTFLDVRSNHAIDVFSGLGARTEIRIVINVVEGKGEALHSVNGGAFQKYAGPFSVLRNDDVTVRASPANGYKFVEWRDGSIVITTSEYSVYDLTVPVKELELYFESTGSDDSSLMWWILVAAALLVLASILIWFLLFYRRTYDVIKVTHSAAIVGEDKVRRKAEYTFTIEGAPAGTVSYRIGEDGSWKPLAPNAKGEYVIPKGEITDSLTVEYR